MIVERFRCRRSKGCQELSATLFLEEFDPKSSLDERVGHDSRAFSFQTRPFFSGLFLSGSGLLSLGRIRTKKSPDSEQKNSGHFFTGLIYSENSSIFQRILEDFNRF